MATRVPSPLVECNCMSPPCSRARASEIGSPRPVPSPGCMAANAVALEQGAGHAGRHRPSRVAWFTRHRAPSTGQESTNKAIRDRTAKGWAGRRPARTVARLGRIVAVRAVMPLCSSTMAMACRADPGQEPGDRHAAEGRYGASVALALVSALSAPMPSNNDEEQELQDRRGGIHRRTAEGRGGRRNHSAAASPAILRSAMSSSAPARTNSPRLCVRCRNLDPRRSIQQDSSIPAMVKIDELLGKHFAKCSGTTGTGKSCAVR